MKIILLANGIVGLEIAKYLKSQNEEIVALGVLDKKRQRLTDEIIKVSGVEKNYIFNPAKIKQRKTLSMLKKFNPDYVVCAFWAPILKSDFLSIPKFGTYNLHPGYLPYNRGMNPNVWPIIEGTPAGVTIHMVDSGIDSGDIIARRKIKIAPTDTADDIYEKTLIKIIKLFKKTWPKIKDGKAKKIKQENTGDKITFHYAKDVDKLDEIKLNGKYLGREIINILRARSYKGRYFAYYKDKGKKIYLRIQLSSKKV